MQDDVLLGLLSLRGEGNPTENPSTSSWAPAPASASASASTTVTSTSTIRLPSAAIPKKKRKREPPSSTKLYCEVQESDVLLGRGGRSNAHNGNMVYRQRILEYQPVYKGLDSHGKRRMSEEIVEWVKNRGGRFLATDDIYIGRYYIATDEAARQKVCQALREDHTPEGRALKKARLKMGPIAASDREEASAPQGTLHRHGLREVATSSSDISTALVLATTRLSTSPSIAYPSPPTTATKRTTEDEGLHANETTYIHDDEIQKSDVLLGRGSGANSHPGNKDYLCCVLGFQRAYKILDAEGKRALIQVVVQWVDLQGGRFLAVDRSPEGHGRYYVASDNMVHEKVSDALQDDNTPEDS